MPAVTRVGRLSVPRASCGRLRACPKPARRRCEFIYAVGARDEEVEVEVQVLDRETGEGEFGFSLDAWAVSCGVRCVPYGRGLQALVQVYGPRFGTCGSDG